MIADLLRELRDYCTDSRYDFPVDLRARIDSALASAEAGERDSVIEECARVCEKRAERRWEEHSYTEPDTNAGYYVGEWKLLGNSLDEEDNDCAAAIRALLGTRPAGVVVPVEWLIWSHEHQGYWPPDRCGYVPFAKAGRFSFDAALEIVKKASYGMTGPPEETMMPYPQEWADHQAAMLAPSPFDCPRGRGVSDR